MLTYKDCLDLCDLTQAEIKAIGEHEHLTDIAALELGQYLIEGAGGEQRIKAIILEDIQSAERRGDMKHALKLKLVLRHFVQTHPDHTGETAA